ncbi:MAG: glycosyltransferase family 1 protein [Pseudomonadaceae bacterium]|nr:glycosyltransferase family 1 protein [Pseudomonadaceae bacterium]
MTKALFITDAWTPQTNGVVRTLQSCIAELVRDGWQVEVIHPGLFRSMPMPTYPEIGLSLDVWKMRRMILQFRPDTIHVATEGPLGLYARSLLGSKGLAYTTSLHTKFPEYVHARFRVPVRIGYAFMRWFHRPALRTLVTTESHRDELRDWGLKDLVVWGRGVDVQTFQPRPLSPRSRPRLLYVGRIAVEKNVEAFLNLDLDADKIVVGDGPQRGELEAKFPQAQWLGYQYGDDLARCYADADVFVFPSKTDTFGLVMLEAMASGTPVAAYPVTGPIDVIEDGVCGAMADDLEVAVQRALQLDRAACRAYAEANSWSAIAHRMAEQFAPIDWTRRGAVQVAG